MIMARWRLVVCVVVSAIVSVAATATAQGRLTVWVVDPSGGAIPGAQVIALGSRFPLGGKRRFT